MRKNSIKITKALLVFFLLATVIFIPLSLSSEKSIYSVLQYVSAGAMILCSALYGLLNKK